VAADADRVATLTALALLSPTVTVQLRASNGTCWDAAYSTPAVDTPARMEAKAD